MSEKPLPGLCKLYDRTRTRYKVYGIQANAEIPSITAHGPVQVPPRNRHDLESELDENMKV